MEISAGDLLYASTSILALDPLYAACKGNNHNQIQPVCYRCYKKTLCEFLLFAYYFAPDVVLKLWLERNR